MQVQVKPKLFWRKKPRSVNRRLTFTNISHGQCPFTFSFVFGSFRGVFFFFFFFSSFVHCLYLVLLFPSILLSIYPFIIQTFVPNSNFFALSFLFSSQCFHPQLQILCYTLSILLKNMRLIISILLKNFSCTTEAY